MSAERCGCDEARVLRCRVAALEIVRVEAERYRPAGPCSASVRRLVQRSAEAERILAQWGSQGAAAALAALRGAR